MLCISTQHAYFENRVPLAESGERVVDCRDSPTWGHASCLQGLFRILTILGRCAGQPHVLEHFFRSRLAISLHPMIRPLLAAFATIAAMF